MNLKTARNRRRKKQTEVAEYAGITLRSYQFYESGEQIPAVDVALKICRFLTVSPFYIDEWQDPLPKEERIKKED
ncbi:helix-turn-helix domain-containing protein [Paenibacillus sp. 1A_MP2]|uniref:helix-turn-helix domain-containing protein n=1 Tax=Paenibacillus sp. 1A_MP2 TaxID=3457495 RepID=UPI003FCC9EAA